MKIVEEVEHFLAGVRAGQGVFPPCNHPNPEVEYDQGGDGITEPGPSYAVYCRKCGNLELTDNQVQVIVERYIHENEI